MLTTSSRRTPVRRLKCLRAARQLPFSLILSLAAAAHEAPAVTIAVTPVGHAGNPDDQDYGSGRFGAVARDFRIGIHEVTNNQYAEFLNAKAAVADPLGLFNSSMQFDFIGGIARSGVSGSFTYAAKPNMGNKPVTYVSWYDAIRFTNWLHNGQGSGDTETGAYTILGGQPTPANGPSIVRNAAATWFLPSENEWYKAAYYDPRDAAQGGPPGNDHYWLFPTQSDAQPFVAAANAVGDISNPGVNVANYNGGANWNGATFGNITTVGSAGPMSVSYYGTFDQGGNVWEWTEQLFPSDGAQRYGRGGSGATPAVTLAAGLRIFDLATVEVNQVGFRVASVLAPPDADFDDDKDVDGADFLKWQRGQSSTALSADELALWKEQFGSSNLPAAAGIPEPSTDRIVLMATAALLLRARALKWEAPTRSAPSTW